jgi:zinc protease
VTLSRLLVGKVVSLGCSITRYGEGLAGSSAPGDLETLLQLVNLQLTAPRLDSLVAARYRTGLDESVRHRNADPRTAFSDTLRILLANHSPELRLLDSSFVRELDPDASLSFFRERFGDASGFTFVLVGNFDPDTILPLLERYLGGLPARPGIDSLEPRGIAPPEGELERVVRRGREPRSTTALVYHREGTVSRRESLAVTALVHVLRHRLQDRLRQALGGVYSVEVSSTLTGVPGPSYRISVEFDADPARREELRDAVLAEVRRLVADGPTTDELDSYRTERRRGLETARTTNGYWLSAISVADQRGWPLDEIPSDREAGELSREQVRSAADRFLSKAGRIQVALLPE